MSNDENFDDLFEPKLTRADVRSEVERTLRDISTYAYQAQAGVEAAVREVSSKHSDFQEMRPKMLSLLAEISLLKDAVLSAESNPQLSSTLPQMYETIYLAAKGSANSAASTTTATAASEPKSGVVSGTRPDDLSNEGVQYQAALASQRVDLSPANRKALITELEKRGVGDIEF